MHSVIIFESLIPFVSQYIKRVLRRAPKIWNVIQLSTIQIPSLLMISNMEFCVFRWLSWTWTTVAPPKLKVWQKSTQIYSFSVWSVLVSQGTFLITLFEASQFRETIFLQLESVGRFNIQLRSVHLTPAIRKHLKIGFVLYPKLEKVDIRFSIGVEKRFLMELRSGYCAVFQKLNYCFGCHLKPFGNHMAKSLMNTGLVLYSDHDCTPNPICTVRIWNPTILNPYYLRSNFKCYVMYSHL